jgi:hypothetical protein
VCLLLLSQQTAFIPIALFGVLNALVNAGSSPASDALVMTVLNKIRSGFGSVRLFASLGWAIAALLSGWLIEQVGLFVNRVAAPTSGFIFDRVGGYWLYALGAIGSAMAWLVMRTMVKSD